MATDQPPDPTPDDFLRRLAKRPKTDSRYKLEGEVARGGMGSIIKIWDEDLRRHLAMKVILGKSEEQGSGATPSVDRNLLARFLEEAQVTGQLDHPGIVPVHEVGLDSDGRVYFTMKLVKGRDLKHIFDLVFEGKEDWNETRALGVILKVCEAMAYAHAKGVIHRDLKPANVMVGSFGEVYVMDWGLSRVLGRNDKHDIRIKPEFTSSIKSVKTERREAREDTPDSPIVTMDGDVMGTPAYMSPEQARGEIEKLGPRSDVYSIGAMLYHLLARQVPYCPPGLKITRHTLLARVVDGPPKPVSSLRKDVPAELVAICEHAMARDASARYRDTITLAADLRAYLERRVVSAYETGTWAETKKWVQRNRPLAAALAAGIVVLIGGITFSSVKMREAEMAHAETAKKNAALNESLKNLKLANVAWMQQATRADLQEASAIRAAGIAKANLEDVLSLSAVQDLSELTQEADRLWPAEPAMLLTYYDWLGRAHLLIHGLAADPASGIKRKYGLADHEAKLAQIRERAKPLTDAQRAVESEIRQTYLFDDPRDRWWNAQLVSLISGLETFMSEQSGGLYSSGTSAEHGWGIEKRAEFARTIADRSVSGAQATKRWEEAIAGIAESPQYGGLRLTPQLGLLPIGEDPHSHLWEFAHLQSGDPAERSLNGKLKVTESMGIVFVLIPGSTFWMGAQKANRAEHNYDSQAVGEGSSVDESPVHAVTLSPYFLSKYEMTQGQWRRVTGRSPSDYGPAAQFNGVHHNLTNPVEQVTWTECMELMRRLGLEVPSEAQWECGCRGGTTTAWWTGAERESLRGKVNIADQSVAKSGLAWTAIKDWPDFEDGWVVHAPIGSFDANPYGLHEVHGNVWEWCRDGYGKYTAGTPVDPMTPWEGTDHRIARGGGYGNTALDVRSAARNNDSPGHHNNDVGLRPARGITP